MVHHHARRLRSMVIRWWRWTTQSCHPRVARSDCLCDCWRNNWWHPCFSGFRRRASSNGGGGGLVYRSWSENVRYRQASPAEWLRPARVAASAGLVTSRACSQQGLRSSAITLASRNQHRHDAGVPSRGATLILDSQKRRSSWSKWKPCSIW